jgi:glycosyltransferase involved in cell wall biosynthesis
MWPAVQPEPPCNLRHLYAVSITQLRRMNHKQIGSETVGFDASPRRRLLVLTHDPDDKIDRRILLQTKLWRDKGWEVNIVAVALDQSIFQETLPTGENVFRIDGHRLLPVRDKYAYSDIVLDYYLFAMRCLSLVDRILYGTPEPTSTMLLPKWGLKRIIRRAFRLAPRIPIYFLSRLSRHRLTPWNYPLPFTESFLQLGRTLPSTVIMACDLPALPAATILAEAWNAKLTYDAHELYPEQSAFTPKATALMELWEGKCIKRVDLAYTVSPMIASRMAEKYSLHDAPKIFYNTPLFSAAGSRREKGRLRSAISARTDATVLLFHGILASNRNLGTLVKAFAVLKPSNAALVFLGYGEVAKYSKLAKATGNPNIFVLNAVPQDELPSWLLDATAVLIPYPAIDANTRYCLPNKLFDCIELGVPVLANSDLSCVKEIVDRYGVGRIAPMNSLGEMTDALASLLKQPPDLMAMQEGFAAARAAFGASTQMAKLDKWLSVTVDTWPGDTGFSHET